MKKIILFILLISIVSAKEHVSFSFGQNFNTLTDEDGTDLKLKSTYSFGIEFTVDLGENFEAGIGADIITMSSIEGVSLHTSDKMIPAYIRFEAKGKENENFVPYFFGTYGKLVTDLQYTKGTKIVTANDGKTYTIGLGAKIQNNLKIEIFDGTYTNSFSSVDGTAKESKDTTNKVLGLKLVYSLK